MPDSSVKFDDAASLIRDGVRAPSTASFTDARLSKSADLLRLMFGNSLERDISNMLSEWEKRAPTTFEALWPNVFSMHHGPNDPERFVRSLSRLVAWIFIETFIREETASTGAMPQLAGLTLGLPIELSEADVTSAIYVQKGLYSALLLGRFESKVAGGLSTIDKAQESIDARISKWEKSLESAIERAKTSEERINVYEASIQKYRVAFGFLGLASAYKEFFNRKFWERIWLLIGLAVIAVAFLSGPFVAINYIGNDVGPKALPMPTSPQNLNQPLPDSKSTKAEPGSIVQVDGKTHDQSIRPDQNPSKPLSETIVTRFLQYLPFAVVELLLIYLFRVVLVHFNAAQIQMLQLEVRMAACGFIDEYVKFRKENGDPDLSKFEALIFGGIVADHDKVPSTFDGLEQMVKAFKEVTKS